MCVGMTSSNIMVGEVDVGYDDKGEDDNVGFDDEAHIDGSMCIASRMRTESLGSN